MSIDGGYFAAPWGRPPSLVIAIQSWEALGRNFLGASALNSGIPSTVWPTASLSIGFPFSVSQPITAVKMFCLNGATVSGNIDIGIYDSAGTLLVSKGSTAQAGTTAMQILDTTDFGLVPGQTYYAFLACDNIAATFRACTANTAVRSQMGGIVQVPSNFPLVTGVTFAKPANAYLPVFGLSQLTTF